MQQSRDLRYSDAKYMHIRWWCCVCGAPKCILVDIGWAGGSPICCTCASSAHWEMRESCTPQKRLNMFFWFNLYILCGKLQYQQRAAHIILIKKPFLLYTCE